MASFSLGIRWGRTNLAQRQVLNSKLKDKLRSWGHVNWLIVRGCTLYLDDSVPEVLEDLGLDSSRCLWSSSHDSDDTLMTSTSLEVPSWCVSLALCYVRVGVPFLPDLMLTALQNYLCFSVHFFLYKTTKMTYVLLSCFRQGKPKQRRAAGLADCL